MKQIEFPPGESLTGVYRLRFSKALESQYRQLSIRQRRLPLMVLFFLLGIGFGLAPLYQTLVFRVSPQLAENLRGLQLLLLAPAMFAAAAVTYFNVDPAIARPVQTLSVALVWTSVLALRHLALIEEIVFPSSIVGAAVVAITIFGRFNWYRVSLGAVIVLIIASIQEFGIVGSGPESISQLFSFVLTALISVLGAYVIDVGYRLSWVNGRSVEIARTDGLTGLATRNEYIRLIPRIFRLAAREARTIAVTVLDIDNFKQINDTHGHLVGDDVLKAVAQVLMPRVKRPLDIIVRFGGDELVIVWYDVDPDTLAGQANGLLNAIREIHVDASNGVAGPRVSASIGTVWLIPKIDTRSEDVLRHADHLMYRAKRSGRDQVLVAPYLPDPKALREVGTVDQ